VLTEILLNFKSYEIKRFLLAPNAKQVYENIQTRAKEQPWMQDEASKYSTPAKVQQGLEPYNKGILNQKVDWHEVSSVEILHEDLESLIQN
jgi:hypothetical protein